MVKERYGKVYLTDRGAFTARYYHDIVRRILHSFPEMPFPLTEEQKYGAACAMAAALPARITGSGMTACLARKRNKGARDGSDPVRAGGRMRRVAC